MVNHRLVQLINAGGMGSASPPHRQVCQGAGLPKGSLTSGGGEAKRGVSGRV
jgi:hypothetical protein